MVLDTRATARRHARTLGAVRGLLGLTVVLVACASESADPLPPKAPETCDALSAPTSDGGCARTGVVTCPSSEGLVAEGGGCRAILPDTCEPGSMAIPGEATCRPVATCSEGAWAGIPRDGAIVFVRAGAVSGDGSEARPFGKIGEALAVAPDNAVIAIDDGSYDEDLIIERRARLWGRCPSTVTIRGVSVATIEARVDAELHRLAVRGTGAGVWIFGAPNVLLDAVWIHDCGARGVEAGGYGKRSRTRIARSLIERVRASGIGAFGAEVVLEGSVIRDVTPRSTNPQSGDGILMRPEKTGMVLGSLEVNRSVIERTRQTGITLSGVPGTVATSVVRDVQPIAAKTHGLGIYCGYDPPTGKPTAALTLRDVIVERTFAVGVQVASGEVTIDRLTIRDIAPELLSGTFGYGLQLTHGRMTANGLAVERAHGGGVCVQASIATIASAWISETLPEVDERFGDGIVVTGDHEDPTSTTSLTLSASRLQKNARAGLSVFGSSATVSTTELSCNGFDLHVGARIGFTESGEPIDGPFALADGGENVCGCGTRVKCAARSEQLEPIRAR